MLLCILSKVVQPSLCGESITEEWRSELERLALGLWKGSGISNVAVHVVKSGPAFNMN